MQLLFFHTNSCPPCKTMQRVAQQYAEHTGIPLFTFRCDDVYGGNEMARQHHVRHIPCLILLGDDGKERYRTESMQTLETLQIAFSQKGET